MERTGGRRVAGEVGIAAHPKVTEVVARPGGGSDDEPTGGGGHGHGGRAARAKADFLANFYGVGDLPPGAFGAGPKTPLGTPEIGYICSMQRALPIIPTPGLTEVIGTFMTELMGRDPAFIVDQLQDPFCLHMIEDIKFP